MPGLIDAHVHLTGDPGTPFWREAIDPNELAAIVGVKNALLTARAGFTTVRDLGAPGIVELRACATRSATGSSPARGSSRRAARLSIVGGHGDVSGFRPEVNAALDPGGTCTGADQCALRVREWAKRGVGRDQDHLDRRRARASRAAGSRSISTRPRCAPSSAPRTGSASRSPPMPMARAGSRTRRAAGVDSIEHGTFADAAALQAMKAKGSWFSADPDGLRPGCRTGSARIFSRRSSKPRRGRRWRYGARRLRDAYRAGVKIAFGTDSGRLRAWPQRRGSRADGAARRDEPARGAGRGDHRRAPNCSASPTRPERSSRASRPT